MKTTIAVMLATLVLFAGCTSPQSETEDNGAHVEIPADTQDEEPQSGRMTEEDMRPEQELQNDALEGESTSPKLTKVCGGEKPPCIPPSAPQNLRRYSCEMDVCLEWDEPLNWGNPSVGRYIVYQLQNKVCECLGDIIRVISETQDTWTVFDLPPGEYTLGVAVARYDEMDENPMAIIRVTVAGHLFPMGPGGVQPFIVHLEPTVNGDCSTPRIISPGATGTQWYLNTGDNRIGITWRMFDGYNADVPANQRSGEKDIATNGEWKPIQTTGYISEFCLSPADGPATVALALVFEPKG